MDGQIRPCSNAAGRRMVAPICAPKTVKPHARTSAWGFSLGDDGEAAAHH
jgi:hypothetical protein